MFSKTARNYQCSTLLLNLNHHQIIASEAHTLKK